MVRIDSADPQIWLQVQAFLSPFFEAHQLLHRTEAELKKLMEIAFVAQVDKQIVGFAALEIYSPKLAEIQCLAVDSQFRLQGIAQQLVEHCVNAARRHQVKELMAISNAEGLFRRCGFDYSLPGQKRALFISPSDSDE